MTQPSLVLAAVARMLRLELQPPAPTVPPAPGEELPQPVDVRVTDHMIDDVADVMTFRAPAVILSATGLGSADRSLGTLTAELQITARCYVRIPGTSADGASGSDTALDLAALVAQLVEGTPVWKDENGALLSVMQPSAPRIQNRSVPAIVARGHAMWSVTWTQRVELTQADRASALHAFKRFHITFEMGDADAPDQELELELEGGTPP